jgi:hypothetical protein
LTTGGCARTFKLHRGLWGARHKLHHLAAFGIYLALSLILTGAPVLAQPTAAHVGLGADPSVMMWCMVWWPWAIARRLNPFISHVIWAPAGFNLTWSTSIPAVALALAPATAAFGPVVSYNIAAILAPALSAWSAFTLCRWLTGNFAAAVAGGLLYGFSPYEMGHVLGGHLSFTINFVPPLCLLLFARLYGQSLSSRRFVASFAAMLILQGLISNEVLATMTAYGAVAWFISYWLLSAVGRARMRAMVAPLAAAYLLAAIVLAPFLYFALIPGAVPRQPLFPPDLFSADLLGFVVPSPLLLFASHSPAILASQAFGNIQENEFYIGLPLLVLISWFLWTRRSECFARILGLMLGVIMVAAIGPVLHVADHAVAGVPWASAFDLPLLRQALPVRLANYGFLIAALIVALSLTPPRRRFSGVLAAYGLAALIPNLFLLRWPGHYEQPSFFTAGLYRKVLHRGENIVVFPYGVTGPSMLWQAQAGMYFSMSGGYAGPIPEEFRRWPAVNAALFGLPLADASRQLRSFLAAHHVEAVVAADGAGPLPASLGIKPITLGGVSVYELPSGIEPAISGATADELEEAAGEQWVSGLLKAARRFLVNGGDLESLNPVRLRQLGLLPEARWGRRLDRVLGGASHGIAGLWIGPGSSRTVAVGLFASPGAAAVLAARYRSQATSILYPYPRALSATMPRGSRVEFLLMTMPVAVVLDLGHRSRAPAASVPDLR